MPEKISGSLFESKISEVVSAFADEWEDNMMRLHESNLPVDAFIATFDTWAERFSEYLRELKDK